MSARFETRSIIAAELVLAGLILLAGCGGSSGGGGDGDDGECSTRAQNRFVHKDMLDWYYWYRQVPRKIDYDRFDSPQQTLAYLRYDALDRFSYITSREAFDNLVNDGKYIGYGFSYRVLDPDSARIRFVYTQSPAGLAGIERGDEILSLNGIDVADIIAADDWDRLFGAPEIGVLLAIELRRKSGQIDLLQLSKDEVSVNTVLHSEIIDSGADRIGYLVFSSFLQTSLAELDTVFTQFRVAGVNRLILDLRYNGGGRISVARELASYIKSTAGANSDLYIELRYNDRHRDADYRYYFRPQGNSLGLDEVVVVTSDSTCSASEQVISGLRPYLSEVTTIGATTCGKPVGMDPIDFCDSTLVAVNFAGYNAAGQGEYFGGIAADCAAGDDYSLAFGDPDEPMFKAARHYQDFSTCLAAPRRPAPPPATPRGLTGIVGAV